MSDQKGFDAPAAWELHTRQRRANLEQSQDDFDKNFADERQGWCDGYFQGVSDACERHYDLAIALHGYLNEESAAHRSAKLVELKTMLRKMGFR